MKSNETIVTNTRRPSRMEADEEEDNTDDDDCILSAVIEEDLLLPLLPGLINGALP